MCRVPKLARTAYSAPEKHITRPFRDEIIETKAVSTASKGAVYSTSYVEDSPSPITSNDINVQFVSRPGFVNLAVIPTACRHSSATNQSPYDNAVRGPKLWNAMLYHLLGLFMLSLTDTPPIRGYTPQN